MSNSFHKLRAAGFIMRGHVFSRCFNSRGQNVAEHTWQATIIALAIEPDLSRNALIALHLHDVGELATGDVPATVKWARPELALMLEQMEITFEKEVGYNRPPLSEYEEWIIKYSDRAELAFTAMDHAWASPHAYDMMQRCLIDLNNKLTRIYPGGPKAVRNQRAVDIYKYLEEEFREIGKRYPNRG